MSRTSQPGYESFNGPRERVGIPSLPEVYTVPTGLQSEEAFQAAVAALGGLHFQDKDFHAPPEGWKDDIETYPRYEGAPRSPHVELAWVSFTEDLTIDQVKERVEKWNVGAREYNRTNNLTPSSPSWKPTYALANRFHLMAYGQKQAELGAPIPRPMVAAGSSAAVGGVARARRVWRTSRASAS